MENKSKCLLFLELKGIFGTILYTVQRNLPLGFPCVQILHSTFVWEWPWLWSDLWDSCLQGKYCSMFSQLATRSLHVSLCVEMLLLLIEPKNTLHLFTKLDLQLFRNLVYISPNSFICNWHMLNSWIYFVNGEPYMYIHNV